MSLEDSSLFDCDALSTGTQFVGVPKRQCGFIFSVKQAKNFTSVHGVTTQMALIFSKLAVISWLGLTTHLILVCHFDVCRLYAALSCGFVAEDVLFMYSLCVIRDAIKRDSRVLELYLFYKNLQQNQLGLWL
jgi:hypothetical protein